MASRIALVIATCLVVYIISIFITLRKGYYKMYQFNPSITILDGDILVAYRYTNKDMWEKSIERDCYPAYLLIKLFPHTWVVKQILKNYIKLEYRGKEYIVEQDPNFHSDVDNIAQFEDPRIFLTKQGELLVTSTVYQYQKARVGLSRLIFTEDNASLSDTMILDNVNNKFEGHQKNWILFYDIKGNLRLMTHVHPELIISSINLTTGEITVISHWDTKDFFSYIDPSHHIRCSTTAVIYGDNLLFALHTLVKPSDYYTLLLVIDGASYQPLRSSNLLKLVDPNYQIEFASGLAMVNNKICLSVGVNDSEWSFITFEPGEIESMLR
jgi:predicted GH43/DUF377 family glycosyl hydrolase